MKKIITTHNLFLLTIFSIPTYLIHMSVLGLPTNILELLTFVSVGAFLLRKNTAVFGKFHQIPYLLTFGSFLLLFGVLFSILSNDAWRTGFGILKSWFLLPMVFSFLLYSMIKTTADLERILKTIYFSTAFVGFVSIVYKMAGLTTYDGRLSAFYLSPNHLAMYLAPGIFFGIYFLRKSIDGGSFLNKTYSKPCLLNMFLLMLIAIPFYWTYSYGAWVAVIASFFATVLLAESFKKKMLSILLVSCIFALSFVFQMGSQKFSDLTSFSPRSSAASRITIWRASTLMIKENPITGIGAGNFQDNYLALQPNFPPYLEWAVPQPHNIFLAFWLQAGLIGLVGFLLILFFVFRTLWSASKDNKSAALAAPLFSFFLYTLLHGLIDTPYWKNDLSFLFWICISLTMFLCFSAKSRRK